MRELMTSELSIVGGGTGQSMRRFHHGFQKGSLTRSTSAPTMPLAAAQVAPRSLAQEAPLAVAECSGARSYYELPEIYWPSKSSPAAV
jgi:hypothetical protein